VAGSRSTQGGMAVGMLPDNHSFGSGQNTTPLHAAAHISCRDTNLMSMHGMSAAACIECIAVQRLVGACKDRSCHPTLGLPPAPHGPIIHSPLAPHHTLTATGWPLYTPLNTCSAVKQATAAGSEGSTNALEARAVCTGPSMVVW
jgi:hypothetical protein